jgi:hypothetical protein
VCVCVNKKIYSQIIRLRGGENPSEGYVEVQGVHPGWGLVCDSRNEWSLKEAHIVCKQLGYGRSYAGKSTRVIIKYDFINRCNDF